jgi:hypothetical protein
MAVTSASQSMISLHLGGSTIKFEREVVKKNVSDV